METLQKIDEYFFRLINSAGWDGMDGIMILISSKWFWIPLYIYILYLIYKRFSDQFIKILFALGFSFLIGAVSGTLPAKQASDMKPVDALRYE